MAASDLAPLKLPDGDVGLLPPHVALVATDWRDLPAAAGLATADWPEVLAAAGFPVR